MGRINKPRTKTKLSQTRHWFIVVLCLKTSSTNDETPKQNGKSNKVGSHIHGVRMGLSIIEQPKDEFGDVQRFCDDCLVTHLPMNYLNNL